jgi:hypothetical protein
MALSRYFMKNWVPHCVPQLISPSAVRSARLGSSTVHRLHLTIGVSPTLMGRIDMAKSRKRSPAGLLSEAGKKTAKALGDAAGAVAGKKPKAGSKSPSGNLSEAVKKAGRGVSDAAKKAVGMQPSRLKKSGT